MVKAYSLKYVLCYAYGPLGSVVFFFVKQLLLLPAAMRGSSHLSASEHKMNFPSGSDQLGLNMMMFFHGQDGRSPGHDHDVSMLLYPPNINLLL